MSEIHYQEITPIDFRDFLKTKGWEIVSDAIRDSIYLFNHPNTEKRQIMIPIDSSSPGYGESIQLAIEKLVAIHGLSNSQIIHLIHEINDDSILFRIQHPHIESKSIPFSYAISSLVGAKELLLSAASSVVQPQLNHSRLSRTEAVEYLNQTKFHHTEKGSFALRVSTPVKSIEEVSQSNHTEATTLPFVRRTNILINQSLSALVYAIRSDSLEHFTLEQKESETPIVSSNLCKAILNFYDAEEYNLTLSFNWAGSVMLSQDLSLAKDIRIERDYYSRIEDLRSEFTKIEKSKEGTFVCSVEKLMGEIGSNNQRHGEVILNLYHEDEVIKAKVYLDTEQYLIANHSHMSSDKYIKIKGILKPGKQPRKFTEISDFTLI
ncbi:MAG: hypothetical protein AAF518_11460 [Spirochaetota bacterium]